MERVIKFRGIAKENGEWVVGSLLVDSLRNKAFITHAAFYTENIVHIDRSEVDIKTIGQFTGLHDKNGKEIYDGDILKDHSGYTWVVFWHSDHACFGCRSDISTSEIIDNSNMEVIGHIYESKPVEK